MTTFLIGLAILIIGGFIYGNVCEKVFGPTDDKTVAYTKEDGMDFVPMHKHKNALIQLLDIAGTGPIVGPIQGILFGPIAFIMIPVGCVLGGSLHDYFSGMICMRNDGLQMPGLVRRYMGNITFQIFNVLLMVLMFLVGAVFIYTPGDIFVTNILKQSATPANPVVWVVYGVIFLYYLAATVLPIDKIIGRIYPIFGALLVISAVGIFASIFLGGHGAYLDNLTSGNFKGMYVEYWEKWGSSKPFMPLIPVFFVTVACGITSGFHSTQATLIARSVQHEKEGKYVFFYMMLTEGFIAMVWAAAAMIMYNMRTAGAVIYNPELVATPGMIGVISTNFLGTVGGIFAVIGVIVLPITSGDTALRSVRLMIADWLNIDTRNKTKMAILALCIFTPVVAILLFAKLDAGGFGILWRYFAWANQTVAIFTFALITIYLFKKCKVLWILALAPGAFYAFVISSFILNANIGAGLPWLHSYIGAGVFTVAYCAFCIIKGIQLKKNELTT